MSATGSASASQPRCVSTLHSRTEYIRLVGGVAIEIAQAAGTVLEDNTIQCGIVCGRGCRCGRRRLVVVVGYVLKTTLDQILLIRLIWRKFIQLQNCFARYIAAIALRGGGEGNYIYMYFICIHNFYYIIYYLSRENQFLSFLFMFFFVEIHSHVPLCCSAYNYYIPP